VPGGHYPRRAVGHRAEVVTVAQFGFTSRNPHPQLQRALSINGGINRTAR